MRRNTNPRRNRVGWAAGVVLLAFGVTSISMGAPAVADEAPQYVVQEYGVLPAPAILKVLLEMESVQRELSFTDAQRIEQQAIARRRNQNLQKARRDIKDRAKLRAAVDAIVAESRAATLANLSAHQRERLGQIQIQAQGPFAFARPDGPETLYGSASLYVGPPVMERLKLSDDQSRRVRTIVQEGRNEIWKAASFPIVLDSKEKPPGPETIRKLVESPEFEASKGKARQAAKATWAVVIRRIEEVLTESQRDTYRKMVGKPFDLATLESVAPGQEREVDQRIVGLAVGGGGEGGGGGGQRADPNFDTKVARPAYAKSIRHPRVLFDEAHNNFHTASGRFKPFAELIANDGYQVIPNREKFTRDMLQNADILLIANALGAESMGQPGASNPAFTDAECDAVRDWVKAGGSLLFITDHAPMGAAAECLAKRFDVNMNKGATADPANSEGGDTSLVFTRQNGLLGKHPITQGRDDSERVNRIRTFTGTSLKGPEGSVAILKLADTAVDLSFQDDKSVSAAGRAQGLALSLGNGRVVVLGEAAELSAQLIGDKEVGMNLPGLDNRQMALNIMHWLSGLLEPRKGSLKKAG
jgi:hypothetical protein